MTQTKSPTPMVGLKLDKVASDVVNPLAKPSMCFQTLLRVSVCVWRETESSTMVNRLLRSREPHVSINTPGCGWAAETKKVLEVFQTLSARAFLLQAIRPCVEKAVWFTRLSTGSFQAICSQQKLLAGTQFSLNECSSRASCSLKVVRKQV